MRNVLSLVAIAALMLSTSPGVLGAKRHPMGTATQPPASLVSQVCIPAGVQESVLRWNLVSPYLLCFVGDAYSGTAKLFQQNGDGSFSRLSHGGGDITEADLEQRFGLSTGTAKQLYSGLHS